MKPAALFLMLTLFGGLTSAQNVCPCVPISHTWIVETCEAWNCAASAMIMADGDPHVLAMPAPANDGRWLIVRRVNTGSYVPPADAPFLLESFDGVDGASARFTSIPSDRGPMILSVPDGKFRGGHGARIAGEAPRREPAVIWIIIRRPMASHTYS